MYVTTRQRGDGFGGTFQNMIWDILYAAFRGDKYIYNSPIKMEHNYDNDSDYINKLMNFTNIPKLFPNQNNNTFHEYSMQEVYPNIEQNINMFYNSDIMSIIKNGFYEDKINPYDINFHNVALHIRRPNSHDSRIDGVNTPNDYYLNIINNIIQNYSGEKPIKIHIYSQGHINNFEEFNTYLPVFHIDEELKKTFLGLVYADELVLSRSSLSYVAGFLSNGKIYYQPFWHPPLKHWI